MKIGILGGTFNPVHYAHLRIAEEVRDRLSLARVMFVPAASPPHKPLAGDLSFEARFEMVQLAVAGNPYFTVSDLEGRRGGTSYSIDTLQALHREYPEDEFFFIVGSDSFIEMGSWRQYAGLFELCNIVAVARPGALIETLAAALPDAVAKDFTCLEAEGRLEHCSGHYVYSIAGTMLDISSSQIRQLVRQGHSIRYLVPPLVENYIKEHGIYGNGE